MNWSHSTSSKIDWSGWMVWIARCVHVMRHRIVSYRFDGCVCVATRSRNKRRTIEEDDPNNDAWNVLKTHEMRALRQSDNTHVLSSLVILARSSFKNCTVIIRKLCLHGHYTRAPNSGGYAAPHGATIFPFCSRVDVCEFVAFRIERK